MSTLDWQQLREKKCPRCREMLIVKSLLESLWYCTCGFEITENQYNEVISKWMYHPKVQKVLVVEPEEESEIEEE